MVQIKVTTGAQERQQQDKTQRGNIFAGGGHSQPLSPYPD